MYSERCKANVVKRLVQLEELLDINGVDCKTTSLSSSRRSSMVVGSSEFLDVGKLLDTYITFKQGKFPYSDLGEKRKKNILAYGYDTKNMSHALRLTMACRDILLSPETYSPKITDSGTANLLLDIKNGRYSIEQTEEVFKYYLLDAELAYHSSKLPEETDLNSFSGIVKELLLHDNV